MVTDLARDDVIELLHRLIEKEGSQRKAARKIGVSVGSVNHVLTGREDPGPAILDFLGLERVILYRKK